MKEYTKEAKAFYHSKQWLKARESYMESVHWICERCGKPAVICHHKKHIDLPMLNNKEMLLGFNNLEALCMECHNREHFKKRITRKGTVFDSDGNLIKSPH